MNHRQNRYFFQYSVGSGFVYSFALQNWRVDFEKDTIRLREPAGRGIATCVNQRKSSKLSIKKLEASQMEFLDKTKLVFI